METRLKSELHVFLLFEYAPYNIIRFSFAFLFFFRTKVAMGSISKGAETSRLEKETLACTSPGSDLEPPPRKMAACPLEIELWRYVAHHFLRAFFVGDSRKRFSLDDQIQDLRLSYHKLSDG